MPRPFEVDAAYLSAHLDEMVGSVFADLQSQFLVLPKGPGFVEFSAFQDAYEVLKQETDAFADFAEARVWDALRRDALCFLVLRTVLGLTPPAWADLARSDRGVDVPQGAARGFDGRCRSDKTYFARLPAADRSISRQRLDALVSVAVEYIGRGAPGSHADTVHRLAKFDTDDGLASVRHAALQHVPYAVLLYERYLGRPFASHRDAVSELVGDVMESAVEERLARARITFRKTGRAEKLPGFDQAPDFLVPTELNPRVVIEGKITGDDGTARDKITRIIHLAEIRDQRERAGEPTFEVVACIDGRGFGVRREGMRQLLERTNGKVFTLSTLDQLIQHARLRDFAPSGSR